MQRESGDGTRPGVPRPDRGRGAPTALASGETDVVALPRRVEFWGDAPAATVVVALAFALVRDARGRVLLAHRVDTGNWELPGGRIEPGETVTAAVTREVAEETGLPITVTGLAGVFCDPGHVVVYPATDEARQQHVTLVHAEPTRPGRTTLRGHDENEIDAARWVELDELPHLPIHPSVRRRLDLTVHRRGDPASPHVD